MKAYKFLTFLLLFSFLLSACGGTDAEIVENTGDDIAEASLPDPTELPPPTEAPTIPPPSFPETSIVAVLGAGTGNTYKVAFGTFAQIEFDDSELPAPPESVEAHWYQSDGFYVLAYKGLNYAEGDALCPGNSIRTSNGFEFVSNAPTDEGACEGFSTLTADPNVGPQVCLDTVIYKTAIPSNLAGTLYGTLEALADEGKSLIGLTSQAETTGNAPEIDLAAICE